MLTLNIQNPLQELYTTFVIIVKKILFAFKDNNIQAEIEFSHACGHPTSLAPKCNLSKT